MMPSYIANEMARLRDSMRALRQRSSERPRADHAAGDAGFTILEILVVITIIGLLIGLVAPAALRQLSGGRVCP